MTTDTTTTRNLIDTETGDDLGPATVDQIDASDNATNGIIWIDDTGDVIDVQLASSIRSGTFAPHGVYSAGVRSVYVEAL